MNCEGWIGGVVKGGWVSCEGSEEEFSTLEEWADG